VKQPVWRHVSSLREQKALSQFSLLNVVHRETQVANQPRHEPASATLKEPAGVVCAAAPTVIVARTVPIMKTDVIDFMEIPLWQ
jgi:hypothetical protein